ncbi:hypothetical protein M0R72_15590 [Candidatus Pacearchaeota archaeon]|jgi:hypothetical protein|nr:hypothetical protein [Candidatus Pacearchaeota archaeon]
MAAKTKLPIIDYPTPSSDSNPLPVTEQNVPTGFSDYSGTTNATPNTADTIAFDPPAKSLIIVNEDDVEYILVSGDGGVTWAKEASGGLAPGDNFPIVGASLESIQIKSTAASVPFSCIATQ